MASSFRVDIDRGWARPRIQRGTMVNTWGAPLSDLALKLDTCEMSDEVRDLVRQVFDEAAHLVASLSD